MLLSVEHLTDDTLLGLWRIDDSAQADCCPEEIRNTLGEKCNSRRSELCSTYALLRAMTGKDDNVIRHAPLGKPFLEGWYISVSHTKGLVGIVLSRSRTVAIDVEYVSPRVNKIIGKFLRDDERAPDLMSRLLHWCAKETVYKYFSEQNLGFVDMRVSLPVLSSSCGQFHVQNLRTMQTVEVCYRYSAYFVVTWCV